jgi:hypothetical protein
MTDKFTALLDIILHYGLEKLGRFYGVYRGEVVSNEDPQNLGRLQIKCWAMYGDQIVDKWVYPRGSLAGLNHGIFWLPNAGDPIWVSTESGDPRFPIWEHGPWVRDSNAKSLVPEGAKPGVFVFLTPKGQRIEMNDNDDYVLIKHRNGFNVKLYADGIYLGKDDLNLGKFMTDLFTLFEATTTATIYGASPFNNLADYTELKTKIAQFLKTS